MNMQRNLNSVAKSDMKVDKRTQPIKQDTTIDQTAPVKSSLTVKERLIRAEGGYYLSGEAAKLLGITEPQLEQLRQTDKIIGLPVKDGRYVYPKWQLTKRWFWGYQVLPGLAEVLAEFPDDSPWMRAGFMLDNGVSVELASPLAGLKAGKIPQVLSLVRGFGEHGAS